MEPLVANKERFVRNMFPLNFGLPQERVVGEKRWMVSKLESLNKKTKKETKQWRVNTTKEKVFNSAL